MQVKTFEAVDMKQALRRVKEELGPQAVIVSSRSAGTGDSSVYSAARFSR